MKKLKDNEIRIIKINSDAVFELISELFTEKAEEYFDLFRGDLTRITVHVEWDRESNDILCAAWKRNPRRKLNIDKIWDETPYTTDTLFQKGRYVNAWLDEHPEYVSD